jgi:hypothetical protein
MQGSFIAVGSMTAGKSGHTATLLPDGKVLMVGAECGLADVPYTSLYDPGTKTFAKEAYLETRRNNFTATLLPDGVHVLAVGGSNPSGYLSSAEQCSPSACTIISHLLQARDRHTATMLPSAKILITGGQNASGAYGYLASTELFAPADSTFATGKAMTVPRADHTATLLTNGTVLLAGGSGSKYLASAELYDPDTGTFTATGDMTMTRSRHSATLLANGLVLITGGLGTNNSTTAELYNPETGKFTATGAMTVQRVYHTATLLTNGLVLIAGGQTTTPSLASAELYDPATGTFTATGNMTAARRDHTATLLKDGTVLIAGGANTDCLASAEIFQ